MHMSARNPYRVEHKIIMALEVAVFGKLHDRIYRSAFLTSERLFSNYGNALRILHLNSFKVIYFLEGAKTRGATGIAYLWT